MRFFGILYISLRSVVRIMRACGGSQIGFERAPKMAK